MTRARTAALVAILLILGAGAFALTRADRSGERPRLLYLSSLPILYGEEFALDAPASPVLDALRKRFDLVPIDVTDPAALARGRILLMAQPRAQTPENLVALDAWVRGGGRVLLLADPMLEWPSAKPLADPTRAPRMFADTGLLAHWGLRLDAPDERGPRQVGGGHGPVIYRSPGRLVSTGGECALSRADIVAECRIGKGNATVVADADFLDIATIGTFADASGQTRELMELLESLTRR